MMTLTTDQRDPEAGDTFAVEPVPSKATSQARNEAVAASADEMGDPEAGTTFAAEPLPPVTPATRSAVKNATEASSSFDGGEGDFDSW